MLKTEVLKKIWILGDPHNNFRYFMQALQNHPIPELVICVGDLSLKQPLSNLIRKVHKYIPSVKFAYVHGNHDSDTYDNWNYLHDGSAFDLHCNILEHKGITITGLGGTFLSKAWTPGNIAKWNSREEAISGGSFRFRNGQKPNPRWLGAIYPEDISKISNLKADILISHEAGSLHPNGNPFLDTIANKIGCRLWFHGHHHDDLIYPSTPTFQMIGVNGGSIKNGLGEILS